MAAYGLNKLLYARDKSAEELMAAKAGEYGRWFQGAARTNEFVNFFTRRVGKALLLWDLKDYLMSGGGGGPNIPFDIIETVDINDPTTWKPPNQTLLDWGLNLWYRQACTDATPEACGMDLYLGKVEGSITKGVARFLGLAASDDKRLKDHLYRIEGDFDKTDLFLFSIVHRTVKAEENVLVISTGTISGSRMSGMGHYQSELVVPANEAAVRLFGGPEPRHVPQGLLVPVELAGPKRNEGGR